MKTLLTLSFFLVCTLFAIGQNPFGSTTIDMESDDLNPLVVDTMMRCILVPRDLQDQHNEFHSEDSCSRQESGVPSCLFEHLVLLDVPQYEDIRTVVPIVDTLEKIFQDHYGNSIVRLLASSSYGRTGFAKGRFVDTEHNIFMHNIHLPDALVREIIYRWIVQREVCILVVARPVNIVDLVDEIHEVLPGAWYLETPYASYEEVPRDPDGFPDYPEEYKVLFIVDGHGLYLRID